MTGKLCVDGDFLTKMVMCARTPFLLSTYQVDIVQMYVKTHYLQS